MTTALAQPPVAAYWPSRPTAQADTPWVPLGPGRALKPIRFFADDRGYVALMRVEAGVAIPRHRHTGETHAYTLEGERELVDGVRIGPGDYVYEPPGNTDTWRAVGDRGCVVLIVVFGAVEYLDDEDRVTARYSAAPMEALYRRYCEEQGVPPRDLRD